MLKFKQSDWMKIYIDFNTEKRMIAANILRNFSKLMINSVYGKTMENLRKRINVQLVNNAEDFTLAYQLILLVKSLVKILLLYTKLNQL